MNHFKTYLLYRLASSISVLSLFIAVIFFSCKKEESADDNSNSSTTEITVSIFGSVRDGNGVALSGVTLKAGTTTITSDANGLFILENVKVPKGRYYVSAEKSGYFDSGRGGLAKEGEYYSVNIVMLSRGTAANLNASTGGVVTTANNSSLTFPTGAIVNSSGQAYTGNVKVYSQYLMPGTASFEDRIPGGDLACQNANGELCQLESYGMIGVELEDNSGNPLNIATGKTVSVRFPIATSQLATAPASIPLLSFDTDKGVWIQEGTATKNGNFYEGEVGHFSWWNCDVIYTPPTFTISGSVEDCNGFPMPGVTVSISGQVNVVTNAQGQYSCTVQPGTHTLQVLSSKNNGLYSSSPITITANLGNTVVPVLIITCSSYVTAQVLDCNGNKTIAGGRVEWMGGYSSIHYSVSGSFRFAVPTNQSITIRVFNAQTNAFTVINSGNLNTTVNAGDIELCSQGVTSGCIGGPNTVSDVDGNVYNVITIGNQCWMKENLKTTKFRNGNSIPGNFSDNAWYLNNGPAQADNNNNQAFTGIYGKLYNWYAVADTSGLCPVGWHVPSDAEWNQLVNYLDSGSDTVCQYINCTQSAIVGGMLKSTGTIQAGDGLWQSPNINATNQTEFTGLPGGSRNNYGIFSSNSSYGIWWSNTSYLQNSSIVALGRIIINSSSDIDRTLTNKKNGCSVRCVRD